MTNQLLPCPLCGGEVSFCDTCNDAYECVSGCSRIGCDQCGHEISFPAIGGDLDVDRESAAAAWNTRHVPVGYVTCDAMNQKMIESISAARKRWAKSDRDLDGYVLVPVEPGTHVVDAMVEALMHSGESSAERLMPTVYKAGIKAAQEDK